MKHIKLFEQHSDYETYINGSDKVLPNVSYCENENDVHFNPYTDPRIIAKFNVDDTTNPTYIMSVDGEPIDGDYYTEIEIDGVVQPSVVSSYTFDTTGEHIVKYTLSDPTEIGEWAFYECTNLASVNIPNSITTIGGGAFDNCLGLTNITIPNSVTSIGYQAFTGCSSLTSITIPNSVTTIGQSAFCYCSGLTNVTIPNSVTSIGNSTFGQCSSLTSINIPNSVTTIGNQVFQYCSGLTSVTIGNSVTTIGDWAFADCSSLTSITSLATTAPTIQNTTFQNVKTSGILYVPSDSTGYDIWMGTGDYYLGKYSWPKVEQ